MPAGGARPWTAMMLTLGKSGPVAPASCRRGAKLFEWALAVADSRGHESRHEIRRIAGGIAIPGSGRCPICRSRRRGAGRGSRREPVRRDGPGCRPPGINRISVPRWAAFWLDWPVYGLLVTAVYGLVVRENNLIAICGVILSLFCGPWLNAVKLKRSRPGRRRSPLETAPVVIGTLPEKAAARFVSCSWRSSPE